MSPVPFDTRIVGAIAIGTSAGGVEALSHLLPALPAELPMPVFIVLHLPRERPSLLVEIFSRRCAVPVREAEDKEPIRPGTVYFAPPDYHLLIEPARPGDGPRLALSTDPPVHFSRPAVDVLLESAADVYGQRLLGIILTGASEDGALGLRAVHRLGGVTMVQDPRTAQAPVMVESALARGPVDLVLTLAEIAQCFSRLGGEGRLSINPGAPGGPGGPGIPGENE